MSIFLNGAGPSSGTKAARVAAIKAVLISATYIKDAADGSKYVDLSALNAYLTGQFQSIATTDAVPAERQTFVADRANLVGVADLTDPFGTTLSKDTWRSHANFPKHTGLSKEQKVAAFVELRGNLRAAVARLQEHYDAQRKEILDAANSTNYQAVVTSLLPEVTIRNTQSRAYFYTYVTNWLWESAPSPVSNIYEADDNDTITLVAAAPSDPNVTAVRFYRSSTTNQSAAYQFVKEVGSAQSWTYVDGLTQAELGEVCPTLNWLPPDDGLRGLSAMPNGVLIGFVGNQIHFSEPFVPYAWPIDYQLTTEHKIVGIGVAGMSAIVLTEGYPYLVSGADSATMSAQKMEFNQSCVAARTIASADGGVLYASPDGLCLANSSGVTVITDGAFSRRDWNRWHNPAGGVDVDWSACFGAYHEGVYYLMDGTNALAIDIKSRRISRLTQSATGAYSDLKSDRLLVANGTSLTSLFTGSTYNAATWKSKVFDNATHGAMSCIRVESDFASSVVVKLYGNGSLVHTATWPANTLPHNRTQRLPSGRYAELEVQVESSCPVTRVRLATSMPELQGAQ